MTSTEAGLPESESKQPVVVVVAEECFNYTAWQNAVPLLRSVVVDNPSDVELVGVVLEMRPFPTFARVKSWKIDRIGPREQVKLRDIDIEVDSEFLDRLDEAVRGVLGFRLTRGDDVIAETSVSLRVLARDEWGGMGAMAELLPAFVTPNDPALVPLLKSAARVLGDHGHATALDGYQSGDPNRVYLLAASLWAAISEKSLTYANPPRSFEQVGQKIRRVSAVLNEGLATCLDSSLLFAAGLESIGLNAILVMLEEHCFVGVWLVNKTLNHLRESECSDLRKAIAAKELIVFETTLVTHVPAASFGQAVATAQESLSEANERKFVAALDVARARMSQVRPIASLGERMSVSDEQAVVTVPPLPAMPGLAYPSGDEEDPKPTTPAGRVERWQRKLLDLSLRNRLLNFVPNKQTVPVLCPNVSKLEDMLAEGLKLRLISLPDENTVGNRDAALHQQRTKQDLDFAFAAEALVNREIACLLEGRELESRLTALYRKVRNDLSEGGSNTLFLAVGFLRWKQHAAQDKTYRAPLLLVPVTLQRRNTTSPFYLASHDDDVRINATLLQLLKKDFGCDLTALEVDLPIDDSGVDVPKVLERIRRAVRQIPGFEVVEEAAVASFSFAKYLMWKDLVERVDQLERNRVVRHLVREPERPFVSSGSGEIPRPQAIDIRYKPADLVHPLPADSSQLAAVMAASEGHDLVIVGPPGTGKSQTIANLIASCLSLGRTVLFVAEKTAALDVVHRRLCANGLGDCCVELHSNKAERRRLLDQLEASWHRRSAPDLAEWVEVNERLRLRRDELNRYVTELHVVRPNGLTIFQAMGIAVRDRQTQSPELTWQRTEVHDAKTFRLFKDSIAELALSFSSLPEQVDLGRLEATDWSMTWESDFLDASGRLKESSESLRTSIAELSSIVGSQPLSDLSSTQLSALHRFARGVGRSKFPDETLLRHSQLDRLKTELRDYRERLKDSDLAKVEISKALSAFASVLGSTHRAEDLDKWRPAFLRLAYALGDPDLPSAGLIFHPRFELLHERLRARSELLRRRNEIWEAILARGFIAALMKRLDVDQLQRAWAQAGSSIWPLSLIEKVSLKKRLKAFMTAEAVPEPDVDLPLLRELQDLIDALGVDLVGIEMPSDLQALAAERPLDIVPFLDRAQRIRSEIQATGIEPSHVPDDVRRSLEKLRAAGRSLEVAAQRVVKEEAHLQNRLLALDVPSPVRSRVETELDALEEQVELILGLRDAAGLLGMSPHALAGLAAVPAERRRKVAEDCRRAAKDFESAWHDYRTLAGTTPARADSESILADARTQAERVLEGRGLLKRWLAWGAARRRAEKLGLTPFVESLRQRRLRPADAASAFDLAYARWWLPIEIDRCDPLRRFQRYLHEAAIEDFRALDDAARRASASRAQHSIYHYLPNSNEVPRKSELGLLRHQMGLKRPSKSIREIIAGMPETFGKLAPCLLMSPLSIAQYLPAEQAQFDVVVFDEASQITTWDAIGAIARGKQTIVVGDPKQLPPTNFFGRSDDDLDSDELDDHEKDLESILDEVKASGLPTVQLNWHYRSRHESLITFSNYHYYNNELITFPASESIDRGVSLTLVSGGVYDRGKSRTNRSEADAIVADAVSRMRLELDKPEPQRLTFGVVTFNSQQQALIQDLFDQALRDEPNLEWFFSDERIEPTAVKNLENVQGDERDVMYFSITFGKDAAGRFPVDFGAINRNGGERRLNVAITRARQALLVFSSFLPDQLKAERSTARGVHDLKAFLEYAYRGPAAIASRIEGSVGESESPFEDAVAAALQERGWMVEPQIGVSGFRIDIGVVHPDRPGAYLAGIECDGATYHRSATARDRDKIRQQVLENLGWRILRVWSPDWFYDSNAAATQLDSCLGAILEESRGARGEVLFHDAGLSSVNLADSASQLLRYTVPPATDPSSELRSLDHPVAEHQPPVGESLSPIGGEPAYVVADLADALANQSRFFDYDYAVEIRRMGLAVIEVESPVRDDVVARRIARAHGFQRTGSRIKAHVQSLLSSVTATAEDVGRFLWIGDQPSRVVPFRRPRSADAHRGLEEISMPELLGLVLSRPDLASVEDPAVAFARELGLARLSKAARVRLESAIEQAAVEIRGGSGIRNDS